MLFCAASKGRGKSAEHKIKMNKTLLHPSNSQTRRKAMATNLSTVLTREQAIQQFEAFVLPTVKAIHEQDGQLDEPARSEAWNDWTDSLCKDGIISDWQYANWTHPDCCG